MKQTEKNSLTTQDKIIKYVTLSLIGLIVLFLFTILFIPKLSMTLFGFATYGTTSGFDSTLEASDLQIIVNQDFDDIEVGDIITFDLKGEEYGDYQGIKTYRVMAIYTDANGERYFHVHSTGMQTSIPNWNINEDMYIGTLTGTIPILGAITGFLSSGFGIAIVFVNVLIVGAIIYLVKVNPAAKPKEETQPESE